MGGSGSCFPLLLVPRSPLLAPPSDLGFGISGDPLAGCVMQVGQLPSLSVFPPFSSLRGPGGWGEVTVMAVEVAEPAELGGPVQVTLLLKARVFGLTPPVLAWGQREGVRTSTLRGCPLESRCRLLSLPTGAAVVYFLWPPCAPFCGLPSPCWRAPPAKPPCLPALMTSCGTCSRLGLGRGCRIPVVGTPCRSGPLFRLARGCPCPVISTAQRPAPPAPPGEGHAADLACAGGPALSRVHVLPQGGPSQEAGDPL